MSEGVRSLAGAKDFSSATVTSITRSELPYRPVAANAAPCGSDPGLLSAADGGRGAAGVHRRRSSAWKGSGTATRCSVSSPASESRSAVTWRSRLSPRITSCRASGFTSCEASGSSGAVSRPRWQGRARATANRGSRDRRRSAKRSGFPTAATRGRGSSSSLRACPRVRLLMIECTFLGEEVRQHGSAYKHLHFDDLVEHAAELSRHEAVVLHHLSRRHSIAELRRAVEARLPQISSRIHLLGEVAG